MATLIIILLIFKIILLLVALAMVIWLIFLGWPSLVKGAPFVPMSVDKVNQVIALAGVKSTDLMVDLGSGDGRLLYAAAKSGAKALGYEINPYLVWYTKWRSWRLGLGSLVTVKLKNFWQADLSEATVVFVYGFSTLMPALEAKLTKQLKNGTRVISLHYNFPNWIPEISWDDVNLYIIKNNHV